MKIRGNPYLRFTDRSVGRALVWAVARFRGPAAKFVLGESPARILVLKLGTIGDSLLMVPALQALQSRYPQAEFVLLHSPANAGVAERVGGVAGRIAFDPARALKNPGYGITLLRDLRGYHADWAVDFEPWSRVSALVALLSGAGMVAGFRTAGQDRHPGFDVCVDHRSDVHESVNNALLADALGAKVTDYSIPFPLSESEDLVWKRFFNPSKPLDMSIATDAQGNITPSHPSPLEGEGEGGGALSKSHVESPGRPPKYVVLHPWSAGYRGHLKEWGTEKCARLAHQLIASGVRVVLTGGPSDRPRSDDLAAKIGEGCISAAGRMTLGETAGLLKGARLVVTVNTGILHLAAAVGSEIVLLDGPAGQERWGPLTSRVTVLKSGAYCSPCLDLGFEYGCRSGWCMSDLRVEEVWKASSEVLARVAA